MSYIGVDDTVSLLISSLKNRLKGYAGALDMIDFRGRTPLFYARSPNLVQLLLDEGANPRVKDKDEKSILEIFLEQNPCNAKTLLSFGITTNNKSLEDRDLMVIYDLSILESEVPIKF